VYVCVVVVVVVFSYPLYWNTYFFFPFFSQSIIINYYRASKSIHRLIDECNAVHYALSNGANPNIINCILRHRPNSARGFDKRGWTPLHVACGVGADISVIKSIIDCYPEAVLMRTNKGSTAKQCLSLTNAANKSDVKQMLQDIYSEVEKNYRPAQEIKSERVLC
jgi:hypothetical protein